MANDPLKKSRRTNRILGAAVLLVPPFLFTVPPPGLGLASAVRSAVGLISLWYSTIRCPHCRAPIDLYRKGLVYSPRIPARCPACGADMASGRAA